jgi:outer membrane protein
MLVAILAAAATALVPQDPRGLINSGRFDEAQVMLEREIAAGSHEAETFFLLGLIATEKGNYRKAIAYFRLALVRDPRSARLRLELGRAFYFAKDYSNAELQFERALAGDLPPRVQANARRFLDRIRREKRWSYSFAFGVAPDTNINAGSSAKETVIFGLPFQLGNNAKMQSGVGLLSDASVEFSPQMDDRLHWKSGIALHRNEYKGTRFDDTVVAGWSGPDWISSKIELSTAATALQRWYAGRLYQRAFGGRIQALFYRGPRTVFLLGGTGQYFEYQILPNQSGPVWSGSAGIVRILDPTTSITLLVNAALQKARTHDLSNRSGIISLSATHDFRGGFTLTVTPIYAVANYEAPDAFFGIRRRERSKEFHATLLNRRAIIWRFTPTLTYTRVRRTSSISLYDIRQDRLELGLTSTF